MIDINMDYEKKYKEALERAKDMLSYKEVHREDMEYLFPELAESEDEKIRKELIEHIKANKEVGFVLFKKISPDNIIAWLEKQGETFTKKDVDDAYLKGVSDAKHELEKQGEQKPAWSEEDDIMIEETLYFLREYQQSNRCKDESGMQNSVSCEKWLKSIKERLS